jgi:hypothetical protein
MVDAHPICFQHVHTLDTQQTLLDQMQEGYKMHKALLLTLIFVLSLIYSYVTLI